MTTKQINRIKDKVYEVEGLLELLHLRPEKLEELSPMILSRIDEARELFVAGVAVEVPTPVVDVEEPVATEPEETIRVTAAEEPVVIEPDENITVTAAEEPVMTVAEEPAVVVQEERVATAESQPGRPLPAFCLNDRFRFRRVIFGGSEAEFNATMQRVSRMKNYEEAEEFFVSDMCLDPADDDVADFLNIIKIYFGR
ncbi:MAG: hypothetical protein K2N88_02745 [Muribaculaceae bacterium]|nr:hypothetical protein [Muribaculaceae bacterium]